MEEININSSLRSFWMFTAKAVVITVLLYLFLSMFIPDFDGIRDDLSLQKSMLRIKLANLFKEERTKVLILSFVQNPAALYKTSEIAERDGRLDSAIRDMELAIGLLEMHNADKQVIKRYNDRLVKLKVVAKPS